MVQYYLEFVSIYQFKFNDLALYGIIDIPGIWTDMLQARLLIGWQGANHRAALLVAHPRLISAFYQGKVPVFFIEGPGVLTAWTS
jgi:hypothetical protein